MNHGGQISVPDWWVIDDFIKVGSMNSHIISVEAELAVVYLYLLGSIPFIL